MIPFFFYFLFFFVTPIQDGALYFKARCVFQMLITLNKSTIPDVTILQIFLDCRECNTDPGLYNDPSPWSKCSSTCPGGSQTRFATHSCGLPSKVERQDCGFAGTYLEWGTWGPCSSSCSGTRVKLVLFIA